MTRSSRTVLKSRSAIAIRVLVIDDSALQCTILEHKLRQLGFARTEQAGDGRRALERMAQVKPDVVIVDQHMLGRDGGKLVSRLCANPKMRNVPVIVSLTESENADVWKKAGFSACLSKPYKGDEIKARLGTVLPDVQFVASI